MTLHRRITKVGGSLGVLIPRDVAEAMGVSEGSPVRLSLVGRQMVIEPEDDTVPDASFRRAFATVVRRYGQTFERLAAHDADRSPRKPRRTSRKKKQ
jgi:antitoxin component of MazEF toxin-antitoxin module